MKIGNSKLGHNEFVRYIVRIHPVFLITPQTQCKWKNGVKIGYTKGGYIMLVAYIFRVYPVFSEQVADHKINVGSG